MKILKIYIIVALILTIGKNANSQYIGTVEMNKHYAATIVFEKDRKITSVVLGSLENDNDGYYNYTPNDPANFTNMIIFASKNPQSPKVSFSIQLDDNSVWVGILKYTDSIIVPYYKNFPEKVVVERKENRTKEDVQTISKSTVTTETKELRFDQNETDSTEMIKRLDIAMKNASKIDLPSRLENKIELSVENIVNDKEHMYVHLSIDNQSSENFEIKGIVFKYIEGKVKNVKNTDVSNDKRIIIQYKIGNSSVQGHTKEELGYVLPMFITGRKGNLVISFNEKNGTRNTQLIVSAEDLYNVEVIK